MKVNMSNFGLSTKSATAVEVTKSGRANLQPRVPVAGFAASGARSEEDRCRSFPARDRFLRGDR